VVGDFTINWQLIFVLCHTLGINNYIDKLKMNGCFTARPPFGQKIVPIFWPAGKTEVFSGKFSHSIIWLKRGLSSEGF
jgi:hypothetical protein